MIIINSLYSHYLQDHYHTILHSRIKLRIYLGQLNAYVPP